MGGKVKKKINLGFQPNIKIALPGFEPGSQPSKGCMLDHYTIGL
jgi:hypothetical protein